MATKRKAQSGVDAPRAGGAVPGGAAPPATGASSGPSAAAAPAAPAADALAEYRKKRDPTRTNEPFAAPAPAATGTLQGRFVVHLHLATSAHFDLRLQFGRTLRSFAIPRGISLDPADRRLAVHTEDHPLEYADYEGVIPAGNYGAGPMIAWDQGRVRYLEGSAEDGEARGKIDFELDGFKLHGRFGLVATGRRSKNPGEARHWLLLKKRDAGATPGRDVTVERPESVLSGLTVEELRNRPAVAARLVARAREIGGRIGAVTTRGLTPMPCALEGAELVDPERLYELKLDGVRLLGERRDGGVVLRHRNGRVANAQWPEVERALACLPWESGVLDGEVCTFDADGRPSFERLLPRIAARRAEDVQRAAVTQPVVYLVFDLLELGGVDVRHLPLHQRKALLADLVHGAGVVRRLDHLEGDGRPLAELCRQHRLEGLVSKRRGSAYQPGPRRGSDWVKHKSERDDDFVVVGFTPGRGSRGAVGALELASFDGERLVYRGKVGSGLSGAALAALAETLPRLAVEASPPAGAPREPGRVVVAPELVAQVRYLGWSEGGHLRFPVFLGLRGDVAPRDCRAAPPHRDEETPEGTGQDEPGVSAPDQPRGGGSRERVVITNPRKVFWPEDGFTKGDLADYYAAVADVLVPFLRGRPVVLVRYPDGIEGKSFYQWRAPPGTPSWIRTLPLPDRDDREEKAVFLLDSAEALLHVVNLGMIPLHVLAWREPTPGPAGESFPIMLDFLTLDFDLGEQPFSVAVRLALSLKELLEEAGLVGYPKTSGQTGLHVLVPLGPGVGPEVAKMLTELLGSLLAVRHADVATLERRVAARGGRALIDVGQTGRSRTIVAPWSVRARRGATVSTPLRWDEVHLALDPERFTILSVPERLTEHGDPWARLLEERPDVLGAVLRLEQGARRR